MNFSYFGSLVDDCKSLAKDFDKCSFVFVKMLMNQVVHVLSRAISLESDQRIYIFVPLSFLINVLAFDNF